MLIMLLQIKYYSKGISLTSTGYNYFRISSHSEA